MDPGLPIAIVFALAFSTTNGLHDASNAIATLVATRAATPLQAIVMAAIFNLVGPLLVGAAVADTIGGIVTAPPSAAIAVIGSGLAAAVAWNVLTWRLGLPSSSGHALVGGLVGAALAEGGESNYFSGGIKEWPAGISRVDIDVGKQRVGFDFADDAGGKNFVQSERAADGKHALAFLHRSFSVFIFAERSDDSS